MAKSTNKNALRYVEKRDRELVALARLILRLIGSTSNILIAAEELKKYFPRLQVLVVDDDLLPEKEAHAYPQRWIVKIRRGIHEGLLRGASRSRWTLVHELAHVLLQHPGRPARNREVLETIKTAAGRREREADIVTRSILMPYESMANLTVDQIKKASGVGATSAARRFIEFSDARSARGAVQRHGLDIRQYTSEFGHRDDTENQFAIVAQTINEILRDHHAHGGDLLEPIKDNLFSTAVLVAAASGLLFDAYMSLKLDRYPAEFIAPAALALSILTVGAIRPVGDTPSQSSMPANLKCAAYASLKLANLPQLELEGFPFLHAEYRPDPHNCGFLEDVQAMGERLIVNNSTVLTLENFPVYEIYNATHDIRWEDVHELEHIAKFLLVLRRAREIGKNVSPTLANT